MKTRLIREDVHGLYVKTDGAIFRPQPNDFYKMMERPPLQTKYRNGEKIKVASFADRMWQLIGDEYWYKHGDCFESDNTEDLWEG
jgi:hypothetical protein